MLGIQSHFFANPLENWQLECWEISYAAIKKHTNCSDIVVFTNDKKLCPKFDNIELLPDTYQTQFNNGWWQIYKQYLYSVSKNFVHIDNDLIFKKDVVFEGEIICEKIRGNNTNTGIVESLGLKRSLELMCSGVMGGNSPKSETLFKQSFDLTLQFINNARIRTVKDSFRWSLEEEVTMRLATDLGLKIQALDDSYYTHFQGRDAKINLNTKKFVKKEYEKLKK